MRGMIENRKTLKVGIAATAAIIYVLIGLALALERRTFQAQISGFVAFYAWIGLAGSVYLLIALILRNRMGMNADGWKMAVRHILIVIVAAFISSGIVFVGFVVYALSGMSALKNLRI
jgi:hypothetical protein